MRKEINILSTLYLTEEQRSQIAAVSEDIQLTVIPSVGVENVPEEKWEEVNVLYTRNVFPLPEQAPGLKWIQLQSVGVDSFLDQPILQQKGLITTSMSGVIMNQVAEYVLMAILALNRKLPQLYRYQQERKWPKQTEKYQQLIPQELRSSTVGIVGYGSIGRQVARLLHSLDVTILAAKKHGMEPEDKGFTQEGMGDPHGDYFDRLYPIEALHSLLRESDFVVMTVTLTEATHHLMNEDAILAMKSSAYLINVGRGALVDHEGKVATLQSKQIAGAALDGFEEEPLPEDSPLWALPNVILSPHIAGISQDLPEETFSFFLENLQRHVEGLPLYNEVDLSEGY